MNVHLSSTAILARAWERLNCSIYNIIKFYFHLVSISSWNNLQLFTALLKKLFDKTIYVHLPSVYFVYGTRDSRTKKMFWNGCVEEFMRSLTSDLNLFIIVSNTPQLNSPEKIQFLPVRESSRVSFNEIWKVDNSVFKGLLTHNEIQPVTDIQLVIV